jgi:cyclopropane-fatty-acyl-phospholipid synthase
MSGAAPAAIRAHYDAGDAFFALFLDGTLTYSCALFDDPIATLDAAQRAKIDWHLDCARVGRGSRLLDVGCGWGALMERAVARGAAEAVGLTLSTAQAAHIGVHGSPSVSARLEHWRDHKVARPYDGVVSIGAFEHFAQPGMSSAARIDSYGRFFAACASWLPAGGVLSMQTMAYPAAFDRTAYDASPWGAFVRQRIFPQSDLPTTAEILSAADATFELITLRNDRRHYAATLRCWLDRLASRRADAVSLVGERRVADFERYFRISKGAFEIGNLLLLRLAFRRRR